MNLLAVSLAFPPLAYPRSIQVARLLKHADASTVLFCAEEPKARQDNTIEPDAEDRLRACIRVPIEENGVSGLIDRISFRFAHGLWNRRNLVPDSYGGWKTAVLKKVTEFVENGTFGPDAIVTFAQPFTDHLIGLELKARLGIPWLAHFSDPWVDNPFMPFDDATRKLNLKLERSVAETADMLVFTSAETIDLFYGKYPNDLRKKARLLPQCYDSDFHAAEHDGNSGPITIRYLGNFYGSRTPKPLIAGLIDLYKKKPLSLENISFELIGSGDAEEAQRLAEPLPEGLVKIRPSVTYRESLDLMFKSDGLLIIDAPAEISVFLPSKLVDYIGAGRPVFGITPAGTAASLIRELGGFVADPGNIPEISDKLERFIEELNTFRKSVSSGHWGNRTVRDRFKASTVAGDFGSMLRELKAV